MITDAQRQELLDAALEIAECNAAITELYEHQLLAQYAAGHLTIDQVLVQLEVRAVENLRRIKAARLRWARRGAPFQCSQ